MKYYCNDCNGNISIVMELLNKIEHVVQVEEWKILEFQAIPLYTEDWSGVGGSVPDSPGQRLYEFTQKLLDEHVVVLSHLEFTTLLESVRSIYYANISFCVSGRNSKITIFDGDIIEINGMAENIINEIPLDSSRKM